MGRPFNKPKPLPSVCTLSDLFFYDGQSGALIWKERDLNQPRAKWFNAIHAGKEAGHVHPNEKSGYKRVTINGEHHFAHRIIWKMMKGEDPEYVDHIDGNTANNRLDNLRSVDLSGNMKNQSLYKNNSSGVSGVLWHSRDKVWNARIGVDGKQLQLGSFLSKEEATAAVIAARVVLNYHPNHGRIAA